MDYLLTAEGMREMEKTVMHNGTSDSTLMRNAAQALYQLLQQNTAAFPCKTPAVLCGAGNNGGDGMVLSLILKHCGHDVTVWYAGPLQNDGTPDESRMSPLLADAYKGACAMGVPVVTEPAACPGNADCIIDALFGIGLSRPVSGTAETWINRVNACTLPVLSVDIPSGISADTGEVMGVAVRAKMTACLGRCKQGLFLYPGAEFAGKVNLCDIGIPADAPAPLSSCEVIFDTDLSDLLPRRPVRSHKGDFGTVAALCGSPYMCGAAILSGKAAYRSGAGLCGIITPESNKNAVFSALPEAVVFPYDTVKTGKTAIDVALGRANVLLAGPGLGTDRTAAAMLQAALIRARQSSLPVILDADALNLIAADKRLRRLIPAGSVITPHFGEASRLLGKSILEIKACPLRAAQALTKELGVVCLLKDAHSVITAPNGGLALNLSGCNALATAGSGDVLCGIIAALMANGMHAEEAARLGAFLHGRAGEATAKKVSARGTIASDIIDGITAVLLRTEKNK